MALYRYMYVQRYSTNYIYTTFYITYMFIYLIRLRPIGTIYTSHFHLPPPKKKQVFTQVSMAGGGERPCAPVLAGGGTLDHRP